MDTLIPPNLSVLSSYLKEHDIDVQLFDTTFYKTREVTGDDARVMSLQVKETDFSKFGIEFNKTNIEDDFKKKIESYKPGLIGLSAVSLTYPHGLKLLQAIPEELEIPTIVGGVHSTVCPEQVIREPSVDMICVGEGEEALLELCETLKEGKKPRNIKNIWTKDGFGRIYRNPIRPPIDINTLPFQDWELFEKRRRLKPMGGKIRITAGLELARGCPFNCLVEDTRILMDGIDKKIQELKVGDVIKGFNLTTERMERTKITKTHVTKNCTYLVVLEDETELNISGEHPIYTKRGWIKVEELTEEDEILKFN